MQRLLLSVVLCLTIGGIIGTLLLCSQATQGEEPQAEQVVWEKVRQLDAQVAELENQRSQVQTQLNQLRQTATDLELQHHEFTRAVEQNRNQIRQAEERIKKAEQALDSARKQRDQVAATVLALAEKADASTEEQPAEAAPPAKSDEQKAETSEKSEPSEKQEDKETPPSLDEQKKQALELKQAAEKTITAQEKELSTARELLQKTEPKLPALREKAIASQARLDQQAHEIKQTQQQLTELHNQQLAVRKQTEQILQQAGLWVSFANEVAPIFHRQCVGCHNVRNAKGHYNMETYQAILAGGESGPAIVPGDSADSLLCLMVAEGEMPLESDPLSQEQIQTIARWVQLGSRLDSAAAPNSRLIRLIPRLPQPPAPKQYHVPVPVTALAVAPSGDRLASSGYHEVLIWSLPEGKLLQRIPNVAESVYGLAFNKAGTQLALAAGTPGRMGEVKVFQPETGVLLHDLLLAEDAVFAVTYSPDDTILAAGGADQSIHLFEAASGKLLRTIDVHADWVNSIAWSPDGQKLVSASRDKSAKVIEVQTGRILRSYTAHGASVTSAMFLSDGKQIVSTGNDRRIRIWDASSGKEVRASDNSAGEQTRLVLHNAKQGLLAGSGSHIRLLTWGDAKVQKQWPTQGDLITSLTLHPQEKWVITGSLTGQIQVLSLESTEPLHVWSASPGFAE